MISLILQHACWHDGCTMNNVDRDDICYNVEQFICTAVYETV